MAMDSDTLLTASTYLNNLLLARGLLRNSKAIDFAKPARETRAQIINLVHDLLLKRDRDEENRDHVADTLRGLRSESERKDAELERLRTRLAEKERALVTAQAEARAARADLKRLQTSAKNTQIQLAKSKALADQIKTQCVNDVRKRDAQIERLKTHIQGQQRGNKSLVVAPSISISGGSGSVRGQNAFNASVHELQDPEYSLKQETNEFLTQLTQSLSDENDGLISLVQGTLRTLRELLGLDSVAEDEADALAEHGENPMTQDGEVGQAVTYERLGAQLSSLLETLSGLLTNPNFVSMEEVDIRDEEIARLRDGWEKMEVRWKDVLLMMDGWRKRMEKTGDTINLDDLRTGLGFGAGFEEIKLAATSPSRLPRPSIRIETSDDEISVPEIISRDSGVSGMTVEEDEAAKEAATMSPVKAIGAVEPPDFFDLRPPKSVKGQKLRQLSENFQSPRRVAFKEPKVDSTPIDVEIVQTHEPVNARALSTSSDENTVERNSTRLRSSKNRKRTSSPIPHPSERLRKQRSVSLEEPQSSSFLEHDVPQMSLAEKLRVAENEAEEARKQPTTSVAAPIDDSLDLELGDKIGVLRSPAKKSKIKGRPRRRKSTLSPEELESLLGL
ncbi:hypothetical protein K461DRAFT_309801, partial [Myriangium duriaei CBS 260.36]